MPYENILDKKLWKDIIQHMAVPNQPVNSPVLPARTVLEPPREDDIDEIFQHMMVSDQPVNSQTLPARAMLKDDIDEKFSAFNLTDVPPQKQPEQLNLPLQQLPAQPPPIPTKEPKARLSKQKLPPFQPTSLLSEQQPEQQSIQIFQSLPPPPKQQPIQIFQSSSPSPSKQRPLGLPFLSEIRPEEQSFQSRFQPPQQLPEQQPSDRQSHSQQSSFQSRFQQLLKQPSQNQAQQLPEQQPSERQSDSQQSSFQSRFQQQLQQPSQSQTQRLPSLQQSLFQLRKQSRQSQQLPFYPGLFNDSVQCLDDGTPIQFYVKALFDYQAIADDEISIRAGDTIAVIYMHEGNNQLTGEILDDSRRIRGSFPSFFVEELED